MAARSVSYPRESLPKTLEFIATVNAQAGASSYLSRENLADIIKSTIASDLASAAAHYGLFEVKVNVGYKITSLYKRIEKPINPQEKRIALLEALKTPKIYSQLLSRFSGERVPTTQFLANTLSREFGIQEAAAPRAAKIFIENLMFAQVIKDGILTFDLSETNIEIKSKVESIDSSTEIVEIDSTPKIENVSVSGGNPKPLGHRIIEVMLNWDRYAKITLPSDPTQEEFLIISEELQRLEKRLFPKILS